MKTILKKVPEFYFLFGTNRLTKCGNNGEVGKKVLFWWYIFWCLGTWRTIWNLLLGYSDCQSLK